MPSSGAWRPAADLAARIRGSRGRRRRTRGVELSIPLTTSRIFTRSEEANRGEIPEPTPGLEPGTPSLQGGLGYRVASAPGAFRLETGRFVATAADAGIGRM